MSDTSQGPGWWLASDGKWYAPVAAQSAPPPPPPLHTGYTGYVPQALPSQPVGGYPGRRRRGCGSAVGVVAALLLFAVVLIVIAVIVNTKSASKSFSTGISNAVPDFTATTPAPPSPVGHVTSTLTVTMQGPGLNTTKAGVTLAKVIDPAQGSNDLETPDNGKRFVGAQFQIASTAGAIDDDADNDASLVGSDNQTYTTDFDTIAGCSNFNSGQVTLAPGASSTGCVTFQVPTGVTVKQIRFGEDLGTVGIWRVP